jgi:hypothetical protein
MDWFVRLVIKMDWFFWVVIGAVVSWVIKGFLDNLWSRRTNWWALLMDRWASRNLRLVSNRLEKLQAERAKLRDEDIDDHTDLVLEGTSGLR